ncbi:MAG: hypothetical protein WCK49_00685 [Myxococcaceae bacterium]
MKFYLILMLFFVNFLNAEDPLAIPTNQTIQNDRIQVETDARLIIKSVGSAQEEAKYFLDDQEITLGFDSFLKEGKHVIRVEKKLLTKTTEVVVKAGYTTYFDIIRHESKLAPHTKEGRAVLLVSDTPHLLPGSLLTQTTLVIFSSRELEPGFKLLSQTLVLDGKELESLMPGIEGKSGFILFEGLVSPGKHVLEATMRFEGPGKPPFTSKFKIKFTAEPGFKTSLVLTNNKKNRVKQEAL